AAAIGRANDLAMPHGDDDRLHRVRYAEATLLPDESIVREMSRGPRGAPGSERRIVGTLRRTRLAAGRHRNDQRQARKHVRRRHRNCLGRSASSASKSGARSAPNAPPPPPPPPPPPAPPISALAVAGADVPPGPNAATR